MNITTNNKINYYLGVTKGFIAAEICHAFKTSVNDFKTFNKSVSYDSAMIDFMFEKVIRRKRKA